MTRHNGTHRQAIEPQMRQAANVIHTKIKMAALGMQEAQTHWMGKDDRYFEGFEDGLNAAKLHIEDAMQAFVDGELIDLMLEVEG
jgi:hypothetical protein